MGPALYRPQLTLFHVKHLIWLAEQTYFGRQGCDDELALKRANLVDKPGQSFAIQLSGGVIEKQGWEGAGELADQVELGHVMAAATSFCWPRERVSRANPFSSRTTTSAR